MMKKLSLMLSLLAVALLLLGGMMSCGSDEPEANGIDYYLEIEEEFLVNGAVNNTDRYKEHNPIAMMKEAIKKAYPEVVAEGNDDAVIEACDEVFERFYEMYDGNGDHLTCLVHLKKVNKEGGIVRHSEYLKTYNIDVNPIEPIDIDYYLEVEEEFLVNGEVNNTDRYKEHNPITMMKEAIKKAYPEINAVGDDDAVIEACDEVFKRFYDMYTGNGDHLTCLVNLIRVKKEGGIVRHSEPLKTYNIDVNPIETGN